jgi:hypothetical protein
LFVENATSHVDLNLSNVAVRFLPQNLTSEVQLMQALINAADKCNSVAEFTRSVTMLDAIRWVHGAWENVSAETKKKCFQHAVFVVSSNEEDEGVKRQLG